MTTIAYKDGILACDSKMTSGGMHSGSVVKIGYHPQFNIALGFCGDAFAAGNALSWLNIATAEDLMDGLMDALGKHGEALFIDGKRKLFIVGGKGLIRLQDKFTSIGSGAPYAMGAMQAGATAIEAIKIASKLDCYTGGKIRHIDLRGK